LTEARGIQESGTDVERRPSVVIIGGGYAGINVAGALDEDADVTLVERRDAFVHNVAALRALVQPTWAPKIFLSYDHLLNRGTVIQDAAIRVDAGSVVLESGQRLTPDFLVLATGSTYPFPAKSDQPKTGDAIDRYHRAHEVLGRAQRVMLLGAGAVGLELAGEIAAAWPDKRVVLVDVAEDILPGPYDQRLRDELSRQLDDLGVERILGSALAGLPETAPGELGAFTVTTEAGTRIDADLWFRSHGIAPVTDYLADDLAAALTADGYLEVNPQLQVRGFDRVYALGDVSAIDANKAAVAGRQAEVVAANIKAQIAGSDELAAYTPGPTAIVLPLGPERGASQLPGHDAIDTGELTAQIKGRDMLIDRYADLMHIQR
jgi:NADH dehydrogenase FAD-containing subunit